MNTYPKLTLNAGYRVVALWYMWPHRVFGFNIQFISVPIVTL